MTDMQLDTLPASSAHEGRTLLHHTLPTTKRQNIASIFCQDRVKNDQATSKSRIQASDKDAKLKDQKVKLQGNDHHRQGSTYQPALIFKTAPKPSSAASFEPVKDDGLSDSSDDDRPLGVHGVLLASSRMSTVVGPIPSVKGTADLSEALSDIEDPDDEAGGCQEAPKRQSEMLDFFTPKPVPRRVAAPWRGLEIANSKCLAVASPASLSEYSSRLIGHLRARELRGSRRGPTRQVDWAAPVLVKRFSLSPWSNVPLGASALAFDGVGALLAVGAKARLGPTLSVFDFDEDLNRFDRAFRASSLETTQSDLPRGGLKSTPTTTGGHGHGGLNGSESAKPRRDPSPSQSLELAVRPGQARPAVLPAMLIAETAGRVTSLRWDPSNENMLAVALDLDHRVFEYDLEACLGERSRWERERRSWAHLNGALDDNAAFSCRSAVAFSEASSPPHDGHYSLLYSPPLPRTPPNPRPQSSHESSTSSSSSVRPLRVLFAGGRHGNVRAWNLDASTHHARPLWALRLPASSAPVTSLAWVGDPLVSPATATTTTTTTTTTTNAAAKGRPSNSTTRVVCDPLKAQPQPPQHAPSIVAAAAESQRSAAATSDPRSKPPGLSRGLAPRSSLASSLNPTLSSASTLAPVAAASTVASIATAKPGLPPGRGLGRSLSLNHPMSSFIPSPHTPLFGTTLGAIPSNPPAGTTAAGPPPAPPPPPLGAKRPLIEARCTRKVRPRVSLLVAGSQDGALSLWDCVNLVAPAFGQGSPLPVLLARFSAHSLFSSLSLSSSSSSSSMPSALDSPQPVWPPGHGTRLNLTELAGLHFQGSAAHGVSSLCTLSANLPSLLGPFPPREEQRAAEDRRAVDPLKARLGVALRNGFIGEFELGLRSTPSKSPLHGASLRGASSIGRSQGNHTRGGDGGGGDSDDGSDDSEDMDADCMTSAAMEVLSAPFVRTAMAVEAWSCYVATTPPQGAEPTAAVAASIHCDSSLELGLASSAEGIGLSAFTRRPPYRSQWWRNRPLEGGLGAASPFCEIGALKGTESALLKIEPHPALPLAVLLFDSGHASVLSR